MFSSDLNQDMGNLQKLADLYNAELAKEESILRHSKSNHDNALGSAIVSRDSINESANRILKAELSSLEKKLATIKSYQKKLRDEEHSLSSEDVDYERYLISAVDNNDAPLPDDVDDAIRFLESTYQAVQNLVSDCLKTKRSIISRAFSKKIPHEREIAYEKIHNAVCLGIRITNFFDNNAWSIKAKIQERIDRERQNKLMDAAEEAQGIANMSIQQAQAAIMALVNEFSAYLKNNLPMQEIETMSLIMEETNSYDISPSFSEAIVIGRIGCPIHTNGKFNITKCFTNWMNSLIVNDTIMIPAIQRLRTLTNIMLLSEDNDVVAKAMMALLFSSIESQPVLRQKIYIYDPVSHGTNFRDLLPFLKQFPSVTGGQVMTNRQQMRDCLDEIISSMDNQLQSVLINYDTVHDYNRNAIERPEPLFYLCIHHFPHDFDEEMIKKLLVIMENGKRCGIQVVMDCEEASIPLQRFDFEELLFALRDKCLVIHFDTNKWVVGDTGAVWFPPKYPNETEMSEFIENYKGLAQASINTVLPLDSICGNRFSMCSSRMLSIPIGKNADGSIRSLEFGDPVSQGTSHHALVFGSLGSGKSTLLHTIIMSAVQNYSPDEINLFLLDFKEGTEFKIYETQKIPHIKVLALDAMQEFGMSVLEEITSIAKQRLELFTRETEKGNLVKDINQYRQTTGKKMPRILVIMDEFQMLFNQDTNRRVANVCAKLFSDIVALYRVCGIHCILATQTMKRIKSGNFSISTATMDEMKVRIGLKCDNSECDLIFKSEFGSMAFRNMGEGRGEGVYSENVEIDEPHSFKVAYCDVETQESLLCELSLVGKEGMRIFTGKSIPAFPMHRIYCAAGTSCSVKPATLYLGEPIRIDDPVQIILTKMQRNTTFVCGGDQNLQDMIISSYIASCSSTNVFTDSIYVFDGSTIIGDEPPKRIGAALKSSAKKTIECQSMFDVAELVNELYDIFKIRRQQIRSRQFNGGNVFIIISHLQAIEPLIMLLNGKPIDDYIIEPGSIDFLDDRVSNENDPYGLLAAMDTFSFDLKKPSETGGDVSLQNKLHTLISSGHTCNIHVLVGCTDLQPLRNVMYDFIPMFINRVVFAMNNLDAGRIIPDANLDNMLPNVALFSDGKNPPYQFKPYDILIKED